MNKSNQSFYNNELSITVINYFVLQLPFYLQTLRCRRTRSCRCSCSSSSSSRWFSVRDSSLRFWSFRCCFGTSLSFSLFFVCGRQTFFMGRWSSAKVKNKENKYLKSNVASCFPPHHILGMPWRKIVPLLVERYAVIGVKYFKLTNMSKA